MYAVLSNNNMLIGILNQHHPFIYVMHHTYSWNDTIVYNKSVVYSVGYLHIIGYVHEHMKITGLHTGHPSVV